MNCFSLLRKLRNHFFILLWSLGGIAIGAPETELTEPSPDWFKIGGMVLIGWNPEVIGGDQPSFGTEAKGRLEPIFWFDVVSVLARTYRCNHREIKWNYHFFKTFSYTREASVTFFHLLILNSVYKWKKFSEHLNQGG